MNALIGYTGVVGTAAAQQWAFDQFYRSATIGLMRGRYDLVVCAAPGGSRIQANNDPESDSAAIDAICTALSQCRIQRMILLSSIDSQNLPDTPYGQGRLRLERYCNQQFTNCQILRLSSIIAPHIRKNILYDLKHRTWCDRIDPATQLQWCRLADIRTHCDDMVAQRQRHRNLVSEPIVNADILAQFRPDVVVGQPGATQYSDLQPYYYTRQEIMESIREYLA